MKVKPLFCVLLVALLTVTLASCASPRIEGKAESQQTISDCERFYTLATDTTRTMNTAPFGFQRYLAAQTVAHSWQLTAAYCANRFEEGSLKSAQAQAKASALGAQFNLPSGIQANRVFDQSVSSTMNATSLRAIALAEDRAGFIVEVLAARGVPNATLALSDTHKATASELITLAGNKGNKEDPREKVYDITQILAHPNIIVDQATGLSAPTIAVAQIDCAREELEAMRKSSSDTGNNSDTGAITKTNQQQHVDDLFIMAQLISHNAALSFSFGYPSDDGALFR